MKFEKAPPEIVALFHAVLPDDERIERRKMLGYDAAFMNGNLFGGVFASSLMIRLGDGDREKLLAVAGATPFEPVAGKITKEYVRLPEAMLGDRRALVGWYLRAFAHAASLPVKRRKY